MYSHAELLRIAEDQLRSLALPDAPQLLYSPITYTLQTGGKRMRPVLTLLACNLFRDDITPALHAATALEVFHNFTLLHDDIMDQADLRRGVPTVHVKWSPNVAILSGDAMMILSYRILSESQPEQLMQLLPIFNRLALGVCEGQQYDMDFEERMDVILPEYLHMVELKTSVLLAGALQMGAVAGGATSEDAALLYEFGRRIGLAFQMRDDILDTYGDPVVFGKKIGGDICSNKKTFLLIHALNRANVAQRAELLGWLSKPISSSAAKIAGVKALYETLNIKDVTEREMHAYFRAALEVLDQVRVPAARKASLRDYALSLMNREK